MHGRPRKPVRAEDPIAAAAKASQLRNLQAQLLHNHHCRIYTKDALLANAKLLEINPEIYTAWNYRKLALKHNLEEAGGNQEELKGLVDEELRVVEAALRQNPKSYGAWYHRKWVLNQKFVPMDFDRESKLLSQLLKLDQRNFHGWTYRRFVSELKNIPELEEVKFTMDRINDNISNYSAWHNRSFLLSKLIRKRAQEFSDKARILSDEHELVHGALFTDDQSGWFYHHWLLDQTFAPEAPSLISSWPVHGSDWTLFKLGEADAYNLYPSNGSKACYSLQTGRFPIILYFNLAVKGVDTSVKLSSEFVKNEDLLWRPLSITSSTEARCWVAYIKIQDLDFSKSEAFSVEFNIGHSHGITSMGSQYNGPLQLKFNLKLKSNETGSGDGSNSYPFTWKEANRCPPQEILDMIFSDQMKASKEQLTDESRWISEALCNEIDIFKGLAEDDSKFAKLTLARLLLIYDAMTSAQKSTIPEDLLKLCNELSSQKENLYNDLIKSSPSHAKYYKDEQSLVRISQATTSKESLIEHCHYDIKTSTRNRHFSLNLQNLSLTRFGYFDRLLWVQILDLSHNELQALEGLEALQLLTCLNLSYNHLRSFTALAPVRLLSSLRVLDISNNEIGAHPVDTTRYLCLSPLSHSLDIKNTKDLEEDINLSHSWEAVLTFKDMKLKELNIKGNAAADEILNVLMLKLLPSLVCLDGALVR